MMPPNAQARVQSYQSLRETKPKTNSPNYFSSQTDSNAFADQSPHHAKTPWVLPSSISRSTPGLVPLNENPEYDAFQRQSETKTFALSGLGGLGQCKRDSVAEDTKGKNYLDPSIGELSRSPNKRLLSPGSAAQDEPVRKGSPASFDRLEKQQSYPRLRTTGSNDPVADPKTDRAATLPPQVRGKDQPSLFVTPQHVVNLLESQSESILVLDLRVATQYTVAHIIGALNLCIPTTLLKRPSFNIQKLTETFKLEDQRSRFESWHKSNYIIVYDSSSTQAKDSSICVNTLKKFENEGYKGIVHVIEGGFNEFNKKFASHTECGPTMAASNASRADGGPPVAPVIGGCPIPDSDQPVNPFFGNIRQNMDLIGGVGQIALNKPERAKDKSFPRWLRLAADPKDQGRSVAAKFEAIERREKKRMEQALSSNVSYASPGRKRPEGKAIQIAGIEEGAKNRYNNIWPFEHSRVKLQGPSHCDYINANHVQSQWSWKQYISTQAPIPATFSDFWDVVWQQDVRVIVMLTAEKEGAQVKAHNYWDQKKYGRVNLELLKESRASLGMNRSLKIHKPKERRPIMVRRSSSQPNPGEKSGEQTHVIIRKFTLTHDDFPTASRREVTQLQYSSWPDFGAPAHPAHLLGLVEHADAYVRMVDNKRSVNEPEVKGARPVLVHCSAGCGRTGSFCTVDTVLDMIKRQRMRRKQYLKDSQPAPDPLDVDGSWTLGQDLDLIEKTVEEFRNQRLSMVQSLRQFVLCYECIMEALADSDEAYASPEK
ncbi:hypothetical protein K470DRAFT_261777 [Piedraia hortae CBS 480.64]|uniref:protein-tyrosine-phosphatase n=1 Tax=Piedraia hortae CBS 480.64 TaxID=1314780 RepID=A0A6A7C957_9PEZI|nr:hypothetical protein K470DRAFT_261777 [Piedraia hortae CBS 480.64]